jgi:hypothetical protein
MYKQLLTSLAAACALAVSASTPATSHAKPVYFDAGQFSATLLQSAHEWRLQPITGDAVDVFDRDPTCRSHTAPIPHGVWLVTRDRAGRLQLQAPSSTELPSGFPAQLRLVACGASDMQDAVAVPDIVFTWLADHSGSVMVDE